jgi:tryptophan-rich sensory protein
MSPKSRANGSFSEEGRRLLTFLLIQTTVFGFGFLSFSMVSNNLVSYYVTLPRPAWAPGPGVFAPLILIWCGLVGFATWKIWPTPRKGVALLFGSMQITLKLLWAWTLFSRHEPKFSVGIASFWVLFEVAAATFYRQGNRIAGQMMLTALALSLYFFAVNLGLAYSK